MIYIKSNECNITNNYNDSVRHFYSYLLADNCLLSDNAKQEIYQMQECVSQWMMAYKCKSCQRGLQKMDADMCKTITLDDMNEYTVALGNAAV